MPCEDTPRISCRLDEMIEIMSSFDWNAFLAVLLATLIGAVAALATSFLIARRERVQSDDRRLDQALAEFGQRAIEYRDDAGRYLRECARWAPDGWNGVIVSGMVNEERISRVREPSSVAMLDALQLAQIIAPSRDQHTLTVISGFVHELAEHRGGPFRVEMVQILLPALARWRSGEVTRQAFEAELKRASSGR